MNKSNIQPQIPVLLPSCTIQSDKQNTNKLSNTENKMCFSKFSHPTNITNGLCFPCPSYNVPYCLYDENKSTTETEEINSRISLSNHNTNIMKNSSFEKNQNILHEYNVPALHKNENNEKYNYFSCSSHNSSCEKYINSLDGLKHPCVRTLLDTTVSTRATNSIDNIHCSNINNSYSNYIPSVIRNNDESSSVIVYNNNFSSLSPLYFYNNNGYFNNANEYIHYTAIPISTIPYNNNQQANTLCNKSGINNYHIDTNSFFCSQPQWQHNNAEFVYHTAAQKYKMYTNTSEKNCYAAGDEIIEAPEEKKKKKFDCDKKWKLQV